MTSDISDIKMALANTNGQAPSESGSWLSENVLHPFVNGSGVVQIYDTLANKEAKALTVEETKPFTIDWGVQALSSAAGAIVPYMVAAKVTGAGLGTIGEGLGLQGASASFVASETTAQILGAGLYDIAKKPFAGETRTGNAAGVMAGFAVFGGGNNLVGNLLPETASATGTFVAQSVGRFAVGNAGGLASYEVSNRISNLLGQHNQLNWDSRFQSMASGGFINFGLPLVHEGAQRLIDQNHISSGKGLRVDRHLQQSQFKDADLLQLAKQNPLARVTEAAPGEKSSIDTFRNRVRLAPGDGADVLSHRLQHLRLANVMEPHYRAVAETLKTDPAQAQRQFFNLRANVALGSKAIEIMMQDRMQDRANKVLPPTSSEIGRLAKIGDQIAVNNKSYKQNWKSEFVTFQADPTFRPPIEYEPIKIGKLTSDRLSPGLAEPLGATVKDNGVNFSIAAPKATKVDLLVYSDAKALDPTSVVSMANTNGNWHQFVDGLPAGALYQYRVFGDYTPQTNGLRFNETKVVLDPYAKAVTNTKLPMDDNELAYDNSNPQDPNRTNLKAANDNAREMPKAVVVDPDHFDWEGDHLLGIPLKDSIIYELNLRGFTAKDTTLPDQLRGTYAGLAERIPYLKSLGITAVELMPIMQIDHSAWPGKNPLTGAPLTDQWGYNPLVYMAPDAAFSSDTTFGGQVNEFKSMVKALHENNIEVILDVVYNHTREGNQYGPTINYKGLANDQYYMLKPGQPDQYVDHTGCGNTVSTNDPLTMKLILDSLRYWVDEMHVDGFRFDLASIFKYDTDGSVKDKSPIIAAIENDPVLSKVKLVAEPWSMDQYDAGHFSDKTWAEWSGQFRDTLRRFVKGDTGQLGKLADMIAGSPSQFDPTKGRLPINPITVHDGFTMNDLVTYMQKHNQANGENNRDGTNDNFNWNGGVEGPLDKATGLTDKQKADIAHLRTGMMKSMRTVQFMSQGAPILLWGDEIRRTADGNNNYWVQPDANDMPWDQLQENQDMLRFNQLLNRARTENAIGSRGAASIIWHGTEPNKPDFSDGARVIAMEYQATKPGERPIYMASNAYWEPLQITLPAGSWYQIVNTDSPSGQDIVTSEQAPLMPQTITIQPRSSIVLQQAPQMVIPEAKPTGVGF